MAWKAVVACFKNLFWNWLEGPQASVVLMALNFDTSIFRM